MKRPLKILLVAVGACAALVALLVVLAFTPAVQTWVVRRAVADVPGVKIEVGRAAIRLHSVRLENVRVEQPGLVLTLPAAVVELPLADAIKGRVAISRLVAKGWTLDLSGTAPAKPATPAKAFEGVFKFLKLPVALTLDHAELEGDVVQAGGKTHVTVSGGGLGAGKESAFKIATAHTATAPDAPARTASATAELTVGMDGPDTINRLALTADVVTAGPKINGEARARLTVSARRDAAGGESYAVSVRSGARELASLEAALPAGGGAFTGKWTVDAGDADLAPLRQFLPAGPLPVFAAKGQGAFTASRDLREFSAAGKIVGSAEKLETLRQELAAMGRVEFAADFDAEERDGLTRVTRLTVTLGGAEPVATVETLQAFEFDRATGALRPANPSADLARASLRNLPLAWAQPWLPTGLRLTGSLSAGLTMRARDSGFLARLTDFAVREGRITEAGQTVWQGGVGVTAATFTYSPQGWQAEIPSLSITSGGVGQMLVGLRVSQAGGAGQLLTLELKEAALDLAGLRLLLPTLASELPATGSAKLSVTAASLVYSAQGWQMEISELNVTVAGTGQTLTGIRVAQAGTSQPLNLELMEGTLDLGGLRLLLPSLAGQLPATGAVKITLKTSLGDKKQLALKLALVGVTAGPQRQSLPDATLDLRADIAADGGIALNAPLTLTREARKSDLTIGGTFTPTKAGWSFDAQVAGETLHIDDLKTLAALAPESSAPKPAGAPWAGLAGSAKFAVKRVVFPPTYAGSLAGTLLLDSNGPKLDAYGALEGPAPSPFTVKAVVAHTPGTAAPYALTADVNLRDFRLGALRSTLDANVDLGLCLTSRATTPGGLAAAAQGRFQLSSKGGVTHLLAKSAPLQLVGTGAALIGAFTGNSTAGTVSRGVARISDLLQEIRFDQLNVLLTRDASNDLVLEDFTLVAPEVRLTGKGRVKSVSGRELINLPLALTFQLAARGAVGDGLRGLGLIAAKPDALGYYPMAFDPEIGGTVGNPDKTSFYNQLMQHALLALVGGTPAPATPAGGGAGQTVEGLLKEAAGGLLNGLLK